jgi:hypothetical protein
MQKKSLLFIRDSQRESDTSEKFKPEFFFEFFSSSRNQKLLRSKVLGILKFLG